MQSKYAEKSSPKPKTKVLDWKMWKLMGASCWLIHCFELEVDKTPSIFSAHNRAVGLVDDALNSFAR
jgi:hypothetical protein